MAENIKWNSPNFTHHHKDRMTLRLQNTNFIQFILLCGAKLNSIIKENYPMLEWKSFDRAIIPIKKNTT